MRRWHQDIKPANILVAGDLENDPYGARFMLADLGLSHFKAVLDDGYDVTGEDTHGARAYSMSPLLAMIKSQLMCGRSA